MVQYHQTYVIKKHFIKRHKLLSNTKIIAITVCTLAFFVEGARRKSLHYQLSVTRYVTLSQAPAFFPIPTLIPPPPISPIPPRVGMSSWIFV